MMRSEPRRARGDGAARVSRKAGVRCRQAAPLDPMLGVEDATQERSSKRNTFH